MGGAMCSRRREPEPLKTCVDTGPWEMIESLGEDEKREKEGVATVPEEPEEGLHYTTWGNLAAGRQLAAEVGPAEDEETPPTTPWGPITLGLLIRTRKQLRWLQKGVAKDVSSLRPQACPAMWEGP